ncbi:Maf family protein [Pseudaestuariivita rosea]|uniref:Maf family protein n=1 Tax=Pseudaestuariivita rosea TaxID=2763263 RepID=UPI001ABAECBE|nr:nucleoside triphosphate pyrophosphatase [Pseudaestuariivita rosea]
MANKIILASKSSVRQKLLKDCGIPFKTVSVSVDEETIKASLLAEKATSRDIADTLAEMKAMRGCEKYPDDFVIGCDQVLDFQGTIFSKASDKSELVEQMTQLQGQSHKLISAAVIYHENQPIWRQANTTTLFMRPLSHQFVSDYVDRNWPGVGESVGGYKIEEEGPRLFSRIQGDHFTILGLPLLELISFLDARGIIRS